MRKLEEVIGLSNIDFNNAIIDFKGLGRDYNAIDLIGYGFDSTCATCSNHYSVVFTTGTVGNTSYERIGYDMVLKLPIDRSITNGQSFVDYLFREISSVPEFVNHCQQYRKDGSKIQIYDNRDYKLGNFYTSAYYIPPYIKAVYNGPEIIVGQPYNISDLTVTMDDGIHEVVTLQQNEYSINPASMTISSSGSNEFTVSKIVEGQNGEPVTLTDTFTVTGIRKIYRVTCEYTGPAIKVYNHYDPKDVELYVYYVDAPLEKHKIPESEYQITDTYVTRHGDNEYRTAWATSDPYVRPQTSQNFKYIVPGVGISHLYALYKGPAIWKNKKYNINDVKVTLIYMDNDVVDIPNNECTFNPDFTIHAPYDNTYQVIWTDKGGNEWIAEYIVPGIAITKVEARYTAYPILLLDSYDTDDVEITAYVSDGSSFSVSPNDCSFDDQVIIWEGWNNKKTLRWKDPCNDIWPVEFMVIGEKRPLELRVEFIGGIKFLGDNIYPYELKVEIRYMVDYFDEVWETLEFGQWFWESLDKINKDNDGEMAVGWSKDYVYKTIKLSAKCKVKYIDLETSTLICWYEGPKIEVGKTFNKNHVVIYLCPLDEDRIRLHYYTQGIIMEMWPVENAGDNWYEVVFSKNGMKLKGKYAVPGFIPKKFPAPDFKVWYVKKESLPGFPEEEDLTEQFNEYFTFREIFVISWEQFLKCVYDFDHRDGIPRYGMYGIIAPKNTGLMNKYASWWHVYCFNDHTLKAEIYHVYDEEENEDGKEESNTNSSSN